MPIKKYHTETDTYFKHIADMFVTQTLHSIVGCKTKTIVYISDRFIFIISDHYLFILNFFFFSYHKTAWLGISSLVSTPDNGHTHTLVLYAVDYKKKENTATKSGFAIWIIINDSNRRQWKWNAVYTLSYLSYMQFSFIYFFHIFYFMPMVCRFFVTTSYFLLAIEYNSTEHIDWNLLLWILTLIILVHDMESCVINLNV